MSPSLPSLVVDQSDTASAVSGRPVRPLRTTPTTGGGETPPLLTGGSGSTPLLQPLSESRFDWYAATVRELPDQVLDGLYWRLASVGAANSVEDLGHGQQGYSTVKEIKMDGNVVARVLSGGRNPYPHVIASSQDCDAVVPALRRMFPDQHSVSRADAALDFDAEGVWDVLLAKCVEMADDARLTINQVGDWTRTDAPGGRTFYLGSRKSPVLTRLYEKGKEQRGKTVKPSDRDRISANWVRLEVQVRPEKQAKYHAASASAAEMWGFSGWTKELAARVSALDVPRTAMKSWRAPSRDRAMSYLARQYGPTLMSLYEELGSWESVGKVVGWWVEGANR